MSPPNVEPGPRKDPAQTSPPLTTPRHNSGGQGQVCIFCHDRPAVWISPTGHPACLACRLDDLYPLIADTLVMVGDLRDQLMEIGELVAKERDR